MFTLYNRLCTAVVEHNRLYNRLDKLCKWAQQRGAWAVQLGRYGAIRLTRSKAAVWTVDDVARLIEI